MLKDLFGAERDTLDLPAGGLHYRSGQLLFAAGEMVIQRACLNTGLIENLVQPGRRIPLPSEQGGGSLDQIGLLALCGALLLRRRPAAGPGT